VAVVVEFVTSAADASGFPRDRRREIAMVGRSNVGKSSLINALAHRQVARTSAAPGKTRLANFYRVTANRGGSLYLVDLPGYGYARVPRGAQGGPGPLAAGARAAAAAELRELAEAYFEARADRTAALLLVDSRHPGLDADRAAWEWLKALPIPKAVIATKADKLTRAERARHAQQLNEMFEGPVRLVSAQSGEGLEELWTLIARMPEPTAAR
jgi:GTP-binding protein